MTRPAPNDPAIAAVRHFTRFFTRRIGVLRKGLYATPFSLVEARVLWEVAHRGGTSSREIARDLSLDPGHLSRILRALAKRGLVRKRAASDDARRLRLDLSAEGKRAFADLDKGSQQEVAELLAPLSAAARGRLVAALGTVERLLGGTDTPADAPVLRTHKIGDMGAIIAGQARLYADEYGWNGEFEALVAEIVAKFVREFDAKRERCWVAEMEGEVVGSIFLVKESDGVAKLRLFYLDPRARGTGLGKRMLAECLGFARACGYAKVVLWTNDCLAAARKLYEKAGFALIESEKHRSFGKDLVGQYWSLDL